MQLINILEALKRWYFQYIKGLGESIKVYLRRALQMQKFEAIQLLFFVNQYFSKYCATFSVELDL